MGARTTRPTAAALGAAAALALAACGGDDPPARAKAQPLGQKLGGSVATLANCRDWHDGARERKLATIDDIRNQLNRDDAGIKTPPLSDEEALTLFDRECAKPYAKGFRLYVLYARAAGYGPLLRDG